MIVFLHGILIEKHPDRAWIDCHGVGYEAGITVTCAQKLPAPGQAVRLWVHHHITEADQRLFGFLDTTEKRLFELLITVKGVGPKTALTILSGLDADALGGAIARQDVAALSRVPGIGKKTAERMVIELRDKMGAPGAGIPGGGGSDARTEAASALEALGYRRADADKALATLAKEGADNLPVSDLVKKALQLLHR